MAGWRDFREIVAWQLAQQLKLKAYSFLEKPNVQHHYSLREQLGSAARSAPANIAEGFGKFGNKEFARFARIAKGSAVEVLNHFIDLRDQRLITEDELAVAEHAARKTINALVGLIRHLESTPDRTRPMKRSREEPL